MENDSCYTVYKHTFPNGKVYIGITSIDPKKRWANGAGYKDNARMYNAIKKYGWDNIQHEILITGLTQEQAYEKEIALIAEHRSMEFDKGYNRHIGGAYMPVDYIDYEGCLPPYDRVKRDPIMKLLLLKLFQKALGYEYYDIVKIFSNGKLCATQSVPQVVKPEIELVEMLYEKYKYEIELKTYIDRAKQILEGDK